MLQQSLLNPRPEWLLPVFALLARHGFLTARQLAARQGEDVDGVTRTLDALTQEGLLHQVTPARSLQGEPEPPAFFLTRAGVGLLRAHAETLAGRVPDPRRSTFMLKHDLNRTELALVLEQLHTLGHLRLLRWETTRARLADVAHPHVAGALERIPLTADGLAVLEVAGETLGLLLEQDEGTVALARMRRKYQGYDLWWRDNGPMRRFGLRNFRVLTVTRTPVRLARLRAEAMQATGNRGSRFLWFALQAHVTVMAPERLLAAVWQFADHTGAHRPLFDALAVATGPPSGRPGPIIDLAVAGLVCPGPG